MMGSWYEKAEIPVRGLEESVYINADRDDILACNWVYKQNEIRLDTYKGPTLKEAILRTKCELGESIEQTGKDWKDFRKINLIKRTNANPAQIVDNIWQALASPGFGFVYFILSSGVNRIKIGYSTDPIRRLKQLRSMSGDELHLILLLEKGSIRAEKKLHQFFKDSRVHGEWFDYTENIKEFINECRAYGTKTSGDENRIRIDKQTTKFPSFRGDSI